MERASDEKQHYASVFEKPTIPPLRRPTFGHLGGRIDYCQNPAAGICLQTQLGRSACEDPVWTDSHGRACGVLRVEDLKQSAGKVGWHGMPVIGAVYLQSPPRLFHLPHHGEGLLKRSGRGRVAQLSLLILPATSAAGTCRLQRHGAVSEANPR